MSEEPPGASTVRSLYAAIASGDLGAAAALLDPAVLWHRPPDVPVTGTLEGAEEVRGMWEAFAGSLERFEIVPSRFEAGAGLLMAPVTFRGSSPSGEFEFGGAQVFSVANGLIAEVWEFRSLPEARELLAG